jgi:DNA-binding response OmpR family regulator
MHALATGPILVVESDRQVARTISEQLLADGFAVELARSAEHARVLAGARTPALAVLGGLDAPRGALELLREIRHADGSPAPWDHTLPAIVLGGENCELEMLRAFEAGADDFMGRPARYLELRARLCALLRRAQTSGPRGRVIEVGPLRIDTAAHVADLEGRELGLRRMEFALLVHLAREPQRVFTKAELLSAVWGYGSSGASRTVDSHASRLRRKLSEASSRRWVISTRGIGYRLI